MASACAVSRPQAVLSARRQQPAGTAARAQARMVPCQASFQPTGAQSPSRPSFRPPGATAVPGKGPAAAGAPAAAKPAGPMPMLRAAFVVPDCHLIFGEQLAVVGAHASLGAWDAAAAPRLLWQEGNTWVVPVALPAGEHAFKLAVIRADGAAFFEEGDDRVLTVPAEAAAVAVATGTGVKVTCRYGDSASTDVTLATAADLSKLAAPPAKPAAATGAGAGTPPSMGPGQMSPTDMELEGSGASAAAAAAAAKAAQAASSKAAAMAALMSLEPSTAGSWQAA